MFPPPGYVPLISKVTSGPTLTNPVTCTPPDISIEGSISLFNTTLNCGLRMDGLLFLTWIPKFLIVRAFGFSYEKVIFPVAVTLVVSSKYATGCTKTNIRGVLTHESSNYLKPYVLSGLVFR